MLQRAASNAYSWWWASHIRTTQSKWLDANLQEMETRVKIMLKLLGEEADSFGKRAEMYYRRRPEVISHVEEVYRAYRALVERYDHISKELHKANHTIATACPEEVQYAMLEEENDDFPKAITPINSRKINKPTVEEILRKKREGQSAQKEGSHGRFTSSTSKEKPEDEISRLQKAILVLQTEKEFVKSSYESGIAKYWEIEKQIADMQEEICHMQGAFDMDAAIEDDEARTLMTVTALKSCQDAVARLVEHFEELIRSARMESEKIRPLQEKLKIMKGDHDQSPNVCVNTSGDSKEVGTTNMQMDDGVCSIDRGILELQPIYEKIEKFFEINSESSVEEMVEKVDELVDKVMNLKLNFPKQAAQIKQLKEENKDLENKLDDLQDEMALRDSPSDLNDQFKQLEDECNRVVVLEQSIFEGEAALKTTFTEVFSCVANISKKIESVGPEDQVALSSSTGNGQTVLESQPSTEVKEKTVAHDGKENFIEEKNLMQEEELREKELPKEGGQTHLIVSETVNAVKRDECSKEDPLEEAAHNSLGGTDDIQHPKNGSEENFPADNDIIQEEFRDEKLLQIGNQVEFFIVCSENQNDLNKTDKCSKESSSEEVSQSSSCGISKIQDTGSDGNANFVPGEKYRDEDSRTLGNQMHPLLAIRTNSLNKKEDCSGEDSAAEVSESSLLGANKIWDLYDGEEKFAKDNSLIQEELNEEKSLETVEQISVTGSENRCHQTSVHVLNRGSEGIEVLNQQASEVPRNSENIDNHIPHSQLERNNSKHKELVREASNSSNCRSRSIRSEKLTSIGEEVAPSWQEFLLNGLEGREAILLADYTSILRNYKETKRRLAELEKENQEHLEETNAVIIELRNANSMKYVEIQSLRKLLNSSEMPLSKADANTAHFSSIRSVKEVDRSNHNVDREISTVEETNVSHTDSPKNASPFEVKFRHEIDVLVDENLQFLVRYSMACHRMQEFDSKYQELQNEMEQLEDENAEEPEAVTRPEPTTEKKLRELKTELDVWFEQNALLNQELQRKTASLCRMQEEISESLHASSEIDGARFTPYESAKFQGEVLNMQQSNNKIQSELQAALYSMRELQAKVNEALRKLCESFELSSRRSSQREAESSYQNQFKHFPSRTRVPLRNFLFGTKPKKKSIFACINPAFQKQFSDLGGNKW